MATLKYWDGTAWQYVGGWSASDFAYVGYAGPSESFAATAGVWNGLEIPSAPEFNAPSGAFTWNADGSVTVRDAGLYHVAASVTSPSAWGTASVRMIAALGYGASAAVAADGLARGDAMSIGTFSFPAIDLAGTKYLPAGTKVWATYFGVASAGSARVQNFSIHRVNAGAQGPQGPQGDTGPPTVIPVVTSLPGSPVDGQEVYYQADAGAPGIIWHLRYRAASPSLDKWECLGGAPLHASVDAAETTAATAYTGTQPATAGPSITLPIPGTYDITVMANLATAAISGNAALVSFNAGGTVAQDIWAAQVTTPAAVVTNADASKTTRLGLGPGQLAIVSRYRSSLGSPGTVTVGRRRLIITPVAFGRTS